MERNVAAVGTVPSHPRLLVSEETFQRLQAQVAADPVSAKLAGHLRADGRRILSEGTVVHELEGHRLLHQSRRCLERVGTLALLARLDGDDRYVERAVAEMRAAAAFPDWNPSHHLDTAEMTLALALGYDWLYDRLSDDDRRLIAGAIKEKGLLPSFEENERHQWWIGFHNNWNQVCHAGLTAGALAIADREPELARHVVQRALENIPKAAAGYGPDGAYPEGPTYWTYGTTFHVVLIELLRSGLGGTFDLERFPGFLASADYIGQMTAPSGLFFNYGDGRAERPFQPVLFWFADRLGRPDLVAPDLAILDRLHDRGFPSSFDPHNWMPFLALLWWRPQTSVPGAPALSWHGRGIAPVAVFRSAWNDPDALFLGIKGGSPLSAHSHMDSGSFVLEAQGVRWAVDPGMQEYHSLEREGIPLFDNRAGQPRWTVFRLGPESHNILRFDGAPLRVEGSAELIGWSGQPEGGHARLDLTPVYAGQAEQVHRDVRMTSPKTILLRDEWRTGNKPVEVTWQWITFAEVIPEKGGFLLRQEGRSLRLRVGASLDYTFEVRDFSKPVRSFDVENPGLRRLTLRFASPAQRSETLEVVVETGDQVPLTAG